MPLLHFKPVCCINLGGEELEDAALVVFLMYSHNKAVQDIVAIAIDKDALQQSPARTCWVHPSLSVMRSFRLDQ